LPTSTLTVTPDSPVFTGERVILKCVINSDHSDWKYEWEKGKTDLKGYGNTFTIERAKTSDAGRYTCKGERKGKPDSKSSSVSLSVKALPRPTLTVTPDTVFTGERVSLKCVINSDHSNWRYEWYKDSTNVSERHTVNTNTLTIERSETSDAGLYTCRGHIDGRSVSSQSSSAVSLSVKASSSLLVTGVVVGLSVCLLFFLSLLLMWRYKKNKDQQRNINQTSVPNQSAQSQPENFPLQSADSDHIYDNVTEVNKRDKDDPEPLADVTYTEVTVKKKMDKGNTKAKSNNVTYSEVGKRGKKCKSKDINPAGPSDLTYAQINIQDKKKTKGKDADAGVGDATHALAFWKKGHKKIKTCP
uniref:Ig-like domain-containing protein n=1 Tax=Cyprinus carpio carpio TaxID=630221 RepID=A0A9J8ABM2_CYPCA